MIADLVLLTGRQLAATLRMPVFALFAVIQPLVWMFLFGHTFPSETLGLSSAEYIAALAPGFAIMAAYFGSAFAGVSMLQDIERGVLQRQLAAPLSRTAVATAYVWHAATLALLQALLLLGVGWFASGSIVAGPVGVFTTAFAAVCVASIFGGLSVSLALVTQRSEVVLTVVNLLGLPLLFTSRILTVKPLPTEWLRTIAAVNPIDLAANFARSGFDRFESPSPLVPVVLLVLAAGANLAAASALRDYLRRL
jgi:ABC-2 type transport system permease protein